MNTSEQIVEAADELFYQRGFEHTSFADIAQAVKISRGNFYYHFRTKDEILDAVIERRLAVRRDMLQRWESEAADPKERLRSFIGILLVNRHLIKRYGCPIGTLCTELSKLGHPAQKSATQLLSLFRSWLKRQFVALGRKKDADALALQLLSRSQGAATLASAFCDEKFLRQEAARLERWLDSCLASPG